MDSIMDIITIPLQNSPNGNGFPPSTLILSSGYISPKASVPKVYYIRDITNAQDYSQAFIKHFYKYNYIDEFKLIWGDVDTYLCMFKVWVELLQNLPKGEGNLTIKYIHNEGILHYKTLAYILYCIKGEKMSYMIQQDVDKLHNIVTILGYDNIDIEIIKLNGSNSTLTKLQQFFN